MYRIIPITGTAFGAGFFLGYLNYGLFDLKYSTPLNAASVVNTQDLVPVTIKSAKDDSSISISRVNEIMKHGYPSLDNLRIFDDFVLSYDRRLVY